ncbi:hypothetical protein F4775DRAFT_522686 [Biscogniauxia sp. FL1348]|nr:hypothetical protein F4775DRAFT_522686 [Biscogniauxia sp. FL1348]
MAKDENTVEQSAQATQDDDEPDEWDKRIFSTGCAGKRLRQAKEMTLTTGLVDENAALTDCYYEKKDWRECKKEMQVFRECWKKHNNDQRTSTKDA